MQATSQAATFEPVTTDPLDTEFAQSNSNMSYRPAYPGQAVDPSRAGRLRCAHHKHARCLDDDETQLEDIGGNDNALGEVSTTEQDLRATSGARENDTAVDKPKSGDDPASQPDDLAIAVEDGQTSSGATEDYPECRSLTRPAKFPRLDAKGHRVQASLSGKAALIHHESGGHGHRRLLQIRIPKMSPGSVGQRRSSEPSLLIDNPGTRQRSLSTEGLSDQAKKCAVYRLQAASPLHGDTIVKHNAPSTQYTLEQSISHTAASNLPTVLMEGESGNFHFRLGEVVIDIQNETNFVEVDISPSATDVCNTIESSQIALEKETSPLTSAQPAEQLFDKPDSDKGAAETLRELSRMNTEMLHKITLALEGISSKLFQDAWESGVERGGHGETMRRRDSAVRTLGDNLWMLEKAMKMIASTARSWHVDLGDAPPLLDAAADEAQRARAMLLGDRQCVVVPEPLRPARAGEQCVLKVLALGCPGSDKPCAECCHGRVLVINEQHDHDHHDHHERSREYEGYWDHEAFWRDYGPHHLHNDA